MIGMDHFHANCAGHEDASPNEHAKYRKSLLHSMTFGPAEGVARTASLGERQLILDSRAFPSRYMTKHTEFPGTSAFRYIKNAQRKRADTDD